MTFPIDLGLTKPTFRPQVSDIVSKPSFASAGKSMGPLAAFGVQAAGSIIEGVFAGKQASKNRKHERERDQYQFAAQRYFDDMKRKRDLEDRRYRQESIGNYRQFSTRQDLKPVMLTDPETVKPVLPQYGSKFP